MEGKVGGSGGSFIGECGTFQFPRESVEREKENIRGESGHCVEDGGNCFRNAVECELEELDENRGEREGGDPLEGKGEDIRGEESEKGDSGKRMKKEGVLEEREKRGGEERKH